MEDDEDMTTPHAYDYSKHISEANPVPTLRRISLSGTLNPGTASSSLEQWMESQAQKASFVTCRI